MDEIDQLIEQLTDPDIDARWKAVVELARHGDRRRIQPLIHMLRDPEAAVRAKAATVLGGTFDRQSVEPLIELLNDTEAEVRASAAYALGFVTHEDSVYPLIDRLSDFDPDVRAAAIESLADIAERENFEADEFIPPVRVCLHDDEASVRGAAINALIRLDAQPAIGELINIAKLDPDGELRQSAIEALGRITRSTDNQKDMKSFVLSWEATDFLLNLLSDSEEDDFLIAAIDALAMIGEKLAVSPIVSLMCDWNQDHMIRTRAADALGCLADPRTLPILIATLRDPEVYMRARAARALGQIGDPSVIPDLERIVQNDQTVVYADKTVAGAAREAIEQIQDTVTWKNLDNVIRFMRSDDSKAQERALKILIERSDEPGALDAIIDALQHADPMILWPAIEFLDETAEVRALPGLNRMIEYSQGKNLRGLIQLAQAAIDHIQGRLNNESDDDSEQADGNTNHPPLSPIGSIRW